MEGNDKDSPLPASEPEKSGRVRSGKARMQGLTPEQRKELGRWAAEKRWGPKTKKSQNDEFIENPSSSEILIYQSEDRNTRIDVRLEDETVWLTQTQMADLFQTTKPNISMHVKNVFAEGELDSRATVKESLSVQNEGGRVVQRKIDLYNLDVIISVGYRVKSPRGTQFRIWATQKIREYIVKGFTLDDERLKNAGTRDDYFDELIRRVQLAPVHVPAQQRLGADDAAAVGSHFGLV